MTPGNQTTPFNVDELRDVLSPKTNPGQPPPGVFVIQLDEARKEWKRRKDSQKRQSRTKYK